MGGSRTKAVFLFVLALSFGVLLFGGYLMNKEKPPIPRAAVAAGESVFTEQDVIDGQNYFYSRGGQHMGSIWGHGAYLAPDWSADYLHRMGLFIAARHLGKSADEAAAFTQADLMRLDAPTRARISALVTEEIKTNRYDAASGNLTLTVYQAEAHASLVRYYTDLFKHGNERMGLQSGIVQSDENGRQVASFFSWIAWAAGTNRPEGTHTYTSNWPYDPLVGNQPLPGMLIWSIVSVILLILGIAGAIFLYQRYIREEDYQGQPLAELPEPAPSASQKATLAYFFVAIALFVLQVVLGSVTGHFTVEGTSFFGIPIGDILPYAAVRTWHVQLAVFFIATCFLAAGLFIGPFVGHEPKHQSKLVWILLAAIVIVVVGSLGGTYASIDDDGELPAEGSALCAG